MTADWPLNTPEGPTHKIDETYKADTPEVRTIRELYQEVRRQRLAGGPPSLLKEMGKLARLKQAIERRAGVVYAPLSEPGGTR